MQTNIHQAQLTDKVYTPPDLFLHGHSNLYLYRQSWLSWVYELVKKDSILDNTNVVIQCAGKLCYKNPSGYSNAPTPKYGRRTSIGSRFSKWMADFGIGSPDHPSCEGIWELLPYDRKEILPVDEKQQPH
ncbi:uncharacterized protein PGTG_17846 [Puccinia graminis f. sp. tritici CRL 75-36-700-3]|uniref:Uncharacterized protein n=1 Tax=Puccinia graminis f. sp. tritici (strain CRL 75-36-700-3 / race SCCL) TaxID=418459 RepID=E3L640_PUCGT|nr:uncharacterized protein PGTG_17846 [Puccinia graminis f. sp. tritici CRL 75-36-700-3]EFP92015.1 hypothetical protein PGTG_17846 [Puccinia graminis f. sp. tritici CRL 75-36-700-3]